MHINKDVLQGLRYITVYGFLFDSLDYRQFIRQYIDEAREKKPWYSYRLVAQKLKNDAGQLVKILQGQRHISERLIPVFSNFLGLKET